MALVEKPRSLLSLLGMPEQSSVMNSGLENAAIWLADMLKDPSNMMMGGPMSVYQGFLKGKPVGHFGVNPLDGVIEHFRTPKQMEASYWSHDLAYPKEVADAMSKGDLYRGWIDPKTGGASHRDYLGNGGYG